jgi:hypothetical protein
MRVSLNTENTDFGFMEFDNPCNNKSALAENKRQEMRDDVNFAIYNQSDKKKNNTNKPT